MDLLRTDDARFADLPGWTFAPRYAEVTAGDGSPSLRMHYVDEGPPDAPPVVLLHGEPSWSYLYRKMIPPLVAAGLRAVAPDLIGFGRSDKPASREDYTYARHVAWLRSFLDRQALAGATLFCQDWGGLLGLRIVGEEPARFARVIAANTFLPTGRRPPDAFFAWRDFSQSVPVLPVGGILRGGTARPLGPGVEQAYEAPFPDERYKAGARQFPTLVPVGPDSPGVAENLRAWEGLERYDRPFLTLFSDQDPITGGAERALQAKIPGARGQAHAIIAQAGHFLQEDAGEELAEHVIRFVRGT